MICSLEYSRDDVFDCPAETSLELMRSLAF